MLSCQHQRFDARRCVNRISMNSICTSLSSVRFFMFKFYHQFNLYSHIFCLLHTVTPNILPFDVDQALFSGESVQMMCHISKGDTPLEVYWEFNGRPLSRELGSGSIVGDRSSVLMLPSVTGAHSGNYTCIAKNRAGVASYTTVLKIIGIHLTYQSVLALLRC